MAIIIFSCPTETATKLLLLESFLKNYDFLVSTEDFQNTRFKIHGKIQKVNILTYNFIKSERYELYLISKRYGVPFCVISEESNDKECPKATNRYDNPFCSISSLSQHWVDEVLKKQIKKSLAHKKLVLNANYITMVKQMIEEVNNLNGNKFYFYDLECAMMKLVESNPKPIDEIRTSYETILANEMNKRGD